MTTYYTIMYMNKSKLKVSTKTLGVVLIVDAGSLLYSTCSNGEVIISEHLITLFTPYLAVSPLFPFHDII